MAEHEITLTLPDPRATSTGPELAKGSIVGGRFVLGEQIGEGGMGRVFRAEDQREGGVTFERLAHGDCAGALTAARQRAGNNIPVFHAVNRRVAARVLLAVGEVDAARVEAEAAVAALAAFPPHLGPAKTTLAACLLAQGDAARARAHSRDAIASLEGDTGHLVEDRWAYLVHAAVLGAERDATTARGILQQGRARLLEDADAIDEPRYRESFLAIPAHARILALADAADPCASLRDLAPWRVT